MSDLTPDALIRYYHRQAPAMQGALRSFWRSIASTGRDCAKPFAEALGRIHHEEHHHAGS